MQGATAAATPMRAGLRSLTTAACGEQGGSEWVAGRESAAQATCRPPPAATEAPLSTHPPAALLRPAPDTASLPNPPPARPAAPQGLQEGVRQEALAPEVAVPGRQGLRHRQDAGQHLRRPHLPHAGKSWSAPAPCRAPGAGAGVQPGRPLRVGAGSLPLRGWRAACHVPPLLRCHRLIVPARTPAFPLLLPLRADLPSALLQEGLVSSRRACCLPGGRRAGRGSAAAAPAQLPPCHACWRAPLRPAPRVVWPAEGLPAEGFLHTNGPSRAPSNRLHLAPLPRPTVCRIPARACGHSSYDYCDTWGGPYDWDYRCACLGCVICSIAVWRK